jgi:hypothetical protein
MNEWMKTLSGDNLVEQMKKWINERMNEWMNEQKDEWINEWMNEGMNEGINEWLTEWLNDWLTWWEKEIESRGITEGQNVEQVELNRDNPLHPQPL